MKKKLKDLFTEDVQKILTEDTLKALQEAIDTKVELAQEAALIEQDDQYATKLKSLIKTIDEDHSKKMKRILEAHDKDKAAKLVSIVKRYDREQAKDLINFKKLTIESVGAFIDEFINETVSKEDLKQAVNNKSAYNILSGLRKSLAVGSAVMKESVSDMVLEAKTELEAVRKENEKIKANYKILKEAKETSEKKLFLEQRSSKFSEDKRKFITKALSDKSVEFIKENFDYTVRLFDKQDKKNTQVIKEEAIQQRKHKPDFVKPEKVITEKVNNTNDTSDMYVTEMEKQRF
jgi:hypothetical protein